MLCNRCEQDGRGQKAAESEQKLLKAQYKLEMQKGETDQLRGELSAIRKLEELELLEWVTSADQLAGMSVVGLREMRARLEKHAAALAEAIPRCVCRLPDPLPLLPSLRTMAAQDDGGGGAGAAARAGAGGQGWHADRRGAAE